MRAAFHDKQIQGKQIEYREGSSLEEIGLREGETVIYEAEESDDEVVELEFGAAVEKIHTHDDYGMYCPNCSNRITRVVLRRKIKQRRVLVASGRDRQDLLGCLSCFSIFIPSGNKLNPFKIFGGKRGRDETTQLQEQLPTSAAAVPSSDTAVPSLGSAVPTPGSAQVEERKLDFFWFLKKRRVDESESDLTSPLLQEPSPAAAVTPKLSRDEATKQEGTLQTSTTTVTSEAIEQEGEVQTSTTTVTSESKDMAIKQGGGVQTSTTPVTSDSTDMAVKRGGEVQTSTTTVTSESWDETIKPGGASQTFTSTVTAKPRDDAIRPAGPAREGNNQIPREQPASDGTTVTTTNTKQVKEKGFDIFWFLKKGRADESDLRTPLIPVAAQIPASSTAFSAVPGIIQTSTTTGTSKPRDEAIKQDGKFQTSTTTVTSKPGDEAIAQQGYLRSSTTTVTPKPGDEAIKQQGMFQTSTRDEAINQEGNFQTSTTTVTSKPEDKVIAQEGIFQTSMGDEAIKEEGYLQTSTRDEAIKQQGTFQSTIEDETFKQDGKFQTLTTTVTSKPGDKAIAQEGFFQTSTGDESIKQGGYLQTSTRDEAIEQQGIFQQSTGDGAIKQEGKFPSSTTTVTPKLSRDEAIKQEGIFQTSTRDEAIKQEGYLQTSTRDEANEQQGIFQRSKGDDAIKKEGKFQTSTTAVTSKPGDKFITQEGYLQTSTGDEAIKQSGKFQTSTTTTTVTSKPIDEADKQEGTLQTFATTVTSKPVDEAINQKGMFQTSETTVIAWQSDEAIKQGYAVSQQEKENKSVRIGLPGDYTETSVYDSFTATETFRGETVGKPERVATAPAIGKLPQKTARQESIQDSVITTETDRVETAQKPERVAIAAAAAVGSVPQIASRQESIQGSNVIIDVYGKQGEAIRQEKPPVQPQLEIRGDGPSSGGDVRITVEETQVETQTTESTDVAVSTTRAEIVTESQPSVWFDILKSIVYGGLTESVISLFVVSLAIASNATAMNVVAIGSAFVVGCFILLLHNLRVLRYGDSTQTSEQRYQAKLGKIERFPLHAFVAMVSHVVFGLIPPVIFGFAFRETGDIEFKMISVGVASFICIFILAIAQAYVRGEQAFMAYFKTVLYYVVFAAIAAGAAFGIAYLLRDPFPCPAALEL